MSNVVGSLTKKTIVISSINQDMQPLLPIITNRQEKDLLVLNSFGAVISQPYGCLIRNVILALYSENVDEIYLIGEQDRKVGSLDKEELLSKMKQAGVSQGTINTLNYIDVVNHDVLDWLVGPSKVQDVMEKNKKFLKGHPFIPNDIPIHAYIADVETGEYYSV
ncbi:hypothetical protein HF078_11080 [Bacillus sp. RO2]|uniref:hypothetical protein n=1 Tax=Bacillus sp. RO2 TaxID=2723913 RepID=UPI00145D2F73|nr:hypothetical protein [Bacillus sp. RO2]NMH73621.1 hypothetical protein [Bacillus sp. RO2]